MVGREGGLAHLPISSCLALCNRRFQIHLGRRRIRSMDLKSVGPLATFRRNFLVGLVALAPVALTIGILTYVFRLLVANRATNWIAARLLRLWPLELSTDWRTWVLQRLAQLTAFLLILLGIVALGFFIRSVLGRRLYRIGERLLESIPVVNRVYLFIRGIAESVLAQRRTLFHDVVCVEYPRPGIYSIAFLTAEVPPKLARELTDSDEPLLAVFVPTTPNPTSGFVVYARAHQVKRLSLSTAEAMTLILSGGTVYPGGGDITPRPRLLDLIQMGEGGTPPATHLPAAPPSS